ncbi:TlpA family protein disulfide reductase [Pseudobacteriovorax antillogorgiicola]|uniref:Cytochrome c biogenesis protein CcmG, thiol:disulfide interchange protein DsbE n=1 Tax=Pseudobacteriovorax antillogorgiicola TaxID=1513793 RepID=A0A1Y6BUL1_9BACT|nr:TlpA disulfide reductase family protein [Pseudobacteriovorax antillogorgiicola]TCS52353.1 cytochrome c biogenesis protein CcmG/thiol:disulfide interchange protein DsbE [Pseudobacteriovorax antillogorgiicola]SMF29554.1 cytochrome c biogenesis protein CcmG, thiol:disulfide interchange protein DsbE [Pseudobacteriovorax antillogorgiicola]
MADQEVKVPGKSRKHIILSIGMIAIGIGFVIMLRKGLDLNPNQIPSALLNKPALDFKAEWLQGRQYMNETNEEYFDLKDFKGQGLILNFWASWCYSCRAEAHDFERFWKAYQDNGVKVVGVAIQDTPEDARRFAAQYGKTYILGLDTDGSAAINYGVTGVPETFVINSEGMILHKEAGPVSEAKLQEFAAMLNQPQ